MNLTVKKARKSVLKEKGEERLKVRGSRCKEEKGTQEPGCRRQEKRRRKSVQLVQPKKGSTQKASLTEPTG